MIIQFDIPAKVQCERGLPVKLRVTFAMLDSVLNTPMERAVVLGKIVVLPPAGQGYRIWKILVLPPVGQGNRI